jgi:hypothetical protein
MPYQGRLPYTYKSPYNYTLDQGTQTVPSLAFLGDTNNGLFSPATDNVAITTNGSEKLRITDTGNVGIGTTDPSGKFHIYGGAAASQIVVSRFSGNASGVTGNVINILTSNLESGAELQAYSLSTANTTFLNSINDAVVLRSSSTTLGGFALLTASSFAPLIFATDSVERVRITPTGNVGIGTTNPIYKLDVQDGSIRARQGALAGAELGGVIGQETGFVKWAADNHHGIWFRGSVGADGIVVSAADVTTFREYGEFQFWTGGQTMGQRLTITSTGNVGIGTTNPTEKLHVYSSGAVASVNIDSSNSGSTVYYCLNGVRQYTTEYVPASNFYSIGRSGVAYDFNLKNGNVGIGTTNPEDRLDLASGFIRFKEAIGGTGTYGGIRAYNSLVPSVSATAIRFIRDVAEVGNDGAICFDTTNNERLRITSAGNVGIGTTNPGTKLDVDGAITSRLTGASGGFRLHTNSGIVAADNVVRFFTGQTYGFNFNSNATGDSTSPLMSITLAGNVGIGTTDPVRKLHLYGTQSALRFTNTDTGSWAGLEWSVANGAYAAYSGLLDSDGRYFIDVGSNGSDDLTILQGGNVGIGTTNPAQKLHVSGNLRLGTDPYIQWVSNYLRFQTTTASVPVIELRESSTGNYEPRLDFYDGDGTTRNISIDANPSMNTYFNAGNVGIGTTNPSEKLEVTGKVRIFDGGYPYIDIGITTSNYFRIIHDNPNDRLFIGKNNNASLVITGGNNVEPGADATQNLGSSTKRWANIYSADIQLSNEGSQNDVDGTWGQYTIQEGENDLFLLNRRNGKKYKFVLQEVN